MYMTTKGFGGCPLLSLGRSDIATRRQENRALDKREY